MPEKDDSKQNARDLINRLLPAVIESNRKGSLPQWTGKGYYDGMWRAPWLTNLIGDSMVRKMGDNALRTKILNADNNYSPGDVEMGRLFQQYVENANKAFTGASFTDKQLDWIMGRMVHPSQDPKAIVGGLIHQKLASDLYDTMIKKGMRNVGMADEEMFKKHYAGNVQAVRDRVDKIIQSPAFLAHADYLYDKYNNLDPRSGKELDGEKPKFEASDFNPYIYAADILQNIYDAEGKGKSITDVIDSYDFGDDELPPGLRNKETILKTFIEKQRRVKNARQFYINRKARGNAGQ